MWSAHASGTGSMLTSGVTPEDNHHPRTERALPLFCYVVPVNPCCAPAVAAA